MFDREDWAQLDAEFYEENLSPAQRAKRDADEARYLAWHREYNRFWRRAWRCLRRVLNW